MHPSNASISFDYWLWPRITICCRKSRNRQKLNFRAAISNQWPWFTKKWYNHVQYYRNVLFVEVLTTRRCIRHLENQNKCFQRDCKASNVIQTLSTTLYDRMLYLSPAKQYTQGAVFLSFRELRILSQERLILQRRKPETTAYYVKKITKLH